MLQVVDVLQYLWGGDHDTRLSYFKWKQINNPYIDHPLGTVALLNGKVVGFRAYFATKWHIGTENTEFILLSPGDTCVHPDHRQKGLSMAMGYKAIEEYESKYIVFLNTSSSPNATPGYKKLRFFALAPKNSLTIYQKTKGAPDFLPPRLKNYLKKSRIFSLILSFYKAKRKFTSQKEGIEFGEFGDVLVSDKPKPTEMSNVIANQSHPNHKIRLCQDEVFFQWRYLSNRNKYIFFYHRKNGSITGYLVIEVSPYDRRHWEVLDYAESSIYALEKILKHIIQSWQMNKLSIQSFGLNEGLFTVLKSLDLHQSVLSHKEGGIRDSGLHLFVRPVKKLIDEKDWLIDGLDIRDIKNWEIKPICNDGS